MLVKDGGGGKTTGEKYGEIETVRTAVEQLFHHTKKSRVQKDVNCPHFGGWGKKKNCGGVSDKAPKNKRRKEITDPASGGGARKPQEEKTTDRGQRTGIDERELWGCR